MPHLITDPIRILILDSLPITTGQLSQVRLKTLCQTPLILPELQLGGMVWRNAANRFNGFHGADLNLSCALTARSGHNP